MSGMGTAAALRQALLTYYPRVRVYLAQIVRDQNAIEDLTQEVFARLLARLTRETVIDDQWGFIQGTLKKVFLEYLRAKRKTKSVFTLHAETGDADQLTAPDTFAREELWDGVAELVQALDGFDHDIIVGKYFLKSTMRELAHALRVPVATVYYQHNQALRRLRTLAIERGIEL